MNRPNVSVSPFEAGIVLGLGAAAVQGFYRVIPPVAYGVCVVGHARDLFNWAANTVFKTSWPVEVVSLVYPLLTVVGIVLGASIAAFQHGELAFRPARRKMSYFAYGFLTMNFGLILGACPVRVVLLTAYGDLLGAAAWAFIVIGAVAATLALRRRAVRGAGQGTSL